MDSILKNLDGQNTAPSNNNTSALRKLNLQKTGGRILMDDERYNKEFFESNMNRSHSVSHLSKFHQKNVSLPSAAKYDNSTYVSNNLNNYGMEGVMHMSSSVANLLQKDKNSFANVLGALPKGGSFHLNPNFNINTIDNTEANILYMLSPLEQKVVQVDNIFRQQKGQIRDYSKNNSSHRNYLESLAKEKTLSFSKDDLVRIQDKARNLHWLSSHEENPDLLRPKEYYIKELPKHRPSFNTSSKDTNRPQQFSRSTNQHGYNTNKVNRDSQYDATKSYMDDQSQLKEFKYNHTIIERNILLNNSSSSQRGRGDSTIESNKEMAEKAVKDYLVKIKCIDPEQMKVLKKKYKQKFMAQDRLANNTTQGSKSIEAARMHKSASLPHIKVTTREVQILKKVKANIDRINKDSKSLVKGKHSHDMQQSSRNNSKSILRSKQHQNFNNESILQNTINQTQFILQDAIDKSQQQKEKDLASKNFMMNVIHKNQLIDQKNYELSNDQFKGKSIQQEMSQIYQTYSKEALGEVSKIKNDMLIQAFKKKIEKDIEKSSKQSGQSRRKNNVTIATKDPYSFEDTPANINLIQRAQKLQERRDMMDSQESAEFKNNNSVLNVSQKRHIYILNDETQIDPQNEQVGKFKSLGNNLNLNFETNSISHILDLDQSLPQSNHSMLHGNQYRNVKTQQQKIEEFLTDTRNKINKLQQENHEMQLMSKAQINGEQNYQQQFQTLNQQVFSLVKSNETQELHRFLRKYGSEYASIIDKVRQIQCYIEQLGETPLHWAVKRGQTECVEILLNHGADPMAQDTVRLLTFNLFELQFGRSVLEFSEKNKILEVDRILKKFVDGKYEINHQKYDARELILGGASPNKKKNVIASDL
ncbi:UNKNOWN [Stylonychia lemnae]|uniref:Uncharacterized protein n=1 Tax=Stylonychia lemnae TaxID=5949 RepID=A0A078B263_STYLE|nr:UNKNOWN [Stylonychia lemnae]|eukprot:CDW87513.1 UNKNOWN [Stylonychia lemnae]